MVTIVRFAPHPFSLRQLQYAVAVADELSFRKAAARCHVSQPSLSAQLALLESVLGTRLFERDRRRVLITTQGAALLERIRAVLLEADDLEDAAKRALDPLAGTLRLGVIPTISPYLLPELTPALRKRYPKLHVRWLEEKTGDLVAMLESGSLDAMLVALEADLGDIEKEVIAIDPFVLAAPKNHPLVKAAGPLSLADLGSTEVLLLDDGHCLRDQALAICARAKAPELEFRATSLPTLTQMVAAGNGVTLLPALAVAAESRGAELTTRPFAKPSPHRTIALAWRRSSPYRESLRDLADTIRGVYPKPKAHKR
jgi:LysR family transcriptional regulator, hydrogen peroxide-inducible genes activator